MRNKAKQLLQIPPSLRSSSETLETDVKVLFADLPSRRTKTKVYVTTSRVDRKKKSRTPNMSSTSVRDAVGRYARTDVKYPRYWSVEFDALVRNTCVDIYSDSANCTGSMFYPPNSD
jgi:hypothetical protein